MLAIILILVIGNYFYQLANRFHQNKWLFAVVGIATYYVVGVIFVLIMVVIDEFVYLGIDWNRPFGLSLMSIPLGLLGVYGLYILLQKKWRANEVVLKDEIKDIGKEEEDIEDKT